MSDNQFSTLGLKESVVKAISDLGFTKPSQIQEQSIPVTLSGADLIGQAQTGTGKTAAYSLPIITKMSDKKGIKALILAPTRELAVQVNDEIQRLSKYEKLEVLSVYGGDSIDRQIKALRRGVDIVVGTPGRMLDLIKRKCLHLDSVEFLVLDEADEMLNMGFIDDIESILSHTPAERQTLLFSATMPDPIAKLAKRYMKPDAKLVSIKRSSLTVSKIEQSYFMINNKHRLEALCRLLDLDNPNSAIIFCKTKRGVDELVQELQSKGYMVEGMHGDMTQAHRLTTLNKFKEGTLSLLIATDVAARGIDVDGVTHVFNYDLPQDVESYVHRIGRTGRANREGTAYSLVTPKDFSMLKQIQNVTKSSITQKPVPTAEEIKNKKFKDMVAIFEKKSYDILVMNTICNATEERQTEAGTIARQSDAMLVIGGKHSSNTQKLYEICSKECPNTYFIQTLDDLNLELFQSFRSVGITAGASTPNNIIKEVQANVRHEQ